MQDDTKHNSNAPTKPAPKPTPPTPAKPADPHAGHDMSKMKMPGAAPKDTGKK